MLGLAAVLATLAGAPPSAPQEPVEQPVRYAALPVRDLAGATQAARWLHAQLVAALEARGATFVTAEALEAELRARRIRYTDSLDAESARAVCARTGADHVLLTSLLEYDALGLPRIGMAVRVLDGQTGERLRSSLVSAAGEDFTGLLELGTIEDPDTLALEVLVRALDLFGPDGAPLPPPDEDSLPGPRPGRAIASYVREGFDPAQVRRIGVLPFTDRSGRPGAGALMAEIFSHVWFEDGLVETVELSELRSAMVRARIRSIDDLDFARLREIAEIVGTPYFLLGSVETFKAEVPVTGDLLPEVELFARILDASTGAVVGGVGIRRRGDDSRTVFELGTVYDSIELARRACRAAVALLRTES